MYIDDQSFVAATVLYRLALEKLPTVSAHSVMGSCTMEAIIFSIFSAIQLYID